MSDQVVHFPVRPLQPGGYSTLDTAGLADAGRVEGKPVVAIIGDCKGGKPNTVLRFTDPQALRNVLRSGPALDAARAVALAAAGQGGDILVVRIGNGIAQATKGLLGSAGTGVTLTAQDYGTWTNAIKVTVSANNKVSVAYTDPLGNTYTETWAVGAAATAQQVADAINGKTAGFAKSAYVTAAAGAGTMPLATLGQTNLTGGADTGTIVSGDWTNGLTPLEAIECDIVVAATGDATVHAQVAAHCNLTSGIQARKERVQQAGGVLGESATQAVARAAALAALGNRTSLAWPGLYVYDDTGTSTLYDPFVVAAGLAGEMSKLPDQATSLVHSQLPWAVDVEKALSTVPGGELDAALAGGVTPINVADGGGIWVVDHLSTNMTVQLLADFHKIRTADAVARYARRRLEGKFVGGKTLTGTAQSVYNESTAILDFLVRSQLIRSAGEVEVKSDPADPRAFLITLPVVLPDTTKLVLLTIALRAPVATTAGA